MNAELTSLNRLAVELREDAARCQDENDRAAYMQVAMALEAVLAGLAPCPHGLPHRADQHWVGADIGWKPCSVARK